jgi:hypothetical protein
MTGQSDPTPAVDALVRLLGASTARRQQAAYRWRAAAGEPPDTEERQRSPTSTSAAEPLRVLRDDIRAGTALDEVGESSISLPRGRGSGDCWYRKPV